MRLQDVRWYGLVDPSGEDHDLAYPLFDRQHNRWRLYIEQGVYHVRSLRPGAPVVPEKMNTLEVACWLEDKTQL